MGSFNRVAKLNEASPRRAASFQLRGIFMSNFVQMMKDEAGASAAEYALILAIVGTGIAGAAILLGGAITGAMGRATTCINTPAGC
jgi:pilus assembly protein Flp/PilA